ncbi:MAG: hypothetical protein K2I91_05260 [Muribaculaceae bacterium]|nr:hypothetical protein [Muribaculaceae bacterium]
MEEERLKQIFGNFNPDMSPDYVFINRLKNNLETVEMIRNKNVRLKARCRRAVIVASLVGIGVGLLLAMILPTIAAAIMDYTRSMFSDTFFNVVHENSILLAGIGIAAVSMVVSLSVYELTMSWHKIDR